MHMIKGNSPLTYLTLQINAGEIDPERLDRLTRQLRGELLELEVASVDFVREDQLPEGAKAADAVTLGTLAVVILPSFLPKLIDYLQSWSLRGEGRKVKVKTQVGDRSIEVEYNPNTMSHQELKTLVETLTGVLADDQVGE
jgi:hypothetical protein